MSKRQRLDILMVERGLAETRSKAKAMIENGWVCGDNGQVFVKAGQEISIDDEIIVTKQDQWVSRAALKLDFALKLWNIKVNSKICLDIGASTGGFTEVLLKNGAAKIYAIDVGHGQLHKSLLDNERIISFEKTNARDLNEQLIPDPIDLIVCDVSFISLQKALPAALLLGKELIALIKPQFEVGRENIGKGVVRDNKLHSDVCERIKTWLIKQSWMVTGIIDSPILGGDGNKEFLIYAKK